jgi:GntR family transcriptional regulator
LQLVEEFGVSRGTVVKALEVLEHRGIVRREQGRGTFVHGNAALRSATDLVSFTRHVARSGHRAGHRVLGWRATKADPDVALHSSFEAGTELIEFERLRLIDDEPVGVHKVATPNEIADRIGLVDYLEADEPWSFYSLCESAGIHVGYGEEHFTAELADERLAELLGIEAPAAVLLVERHTLDLAGVVFEAVEARYVSERYAVTAESRRTRLAAALSQ